MVLWRVLSRDNGYPIVQSRGLNFGSSIDASSSGCTNDAIQLFLSFWLRKVINEEDLGPCVGARLCQLFLIVIGY